MQALPARARSRSVTNAAALSSHFACGSRSLRAGVCKGPWRAGPAKPGCYAPHSPKQAGRKNCKKPEARTPQAINHRQKHKQKPQTKPPLQKPQTKSSTKNRNQPPPTATSAPARSCLQAVCGNAGSHSQGLWAFPGRALYKRRSLVSASRRRSANLVPLRL